MDEPNSPSAPLEPVEALMSIRAILDATVDRHGSMPMEAALRLIDVVLAKALPSFEPGSTPPKDQASSSS